MDYDIAYLEKQPVESRIYTFDFTALMAEDESITAVTAFSVSPSGLTVAEIQFSGKRVQARISGGTNEVQYKITVVVMTDAGTGNTLSLEGNLFVRDA